MIFFLSIHIMWEFTRYGLQEKTELLILSFYFTSIGNGKVLRLYSDSHAVLPQLAWAVNSHFLVFLRSERRKTGICSFTAAIIRGKLGVFHRSERRKTGICSFTAALIRGKLDFQVFLRSERGKTGICSCTAALIRGKLDFPVLLRSYRRKTGICSFNAVLIGGNVDFPVFLRSERRKAGNSRYAKGTYGGYLSIRFFNLFSLLLLADGSRVGA